MTIGYLNRVEKYFATHKITVMDINHLMNKIGSPPSKLSVLINQDPKNRFWLNARSQIVSKKSDLEEPYLNLIFEHMVKKNLQKFNIEQGYKLFGKPSGTLSDLVKKDIHKRFVLTKSGEYELQNGNTGGSSNVAANHPILTFASNKILHSATLSAKGASTNDAELEGSNDFLYVKEVVQLQSIKDRLTSIKPPFIALDVEFIEKDPKMMPELVLLQLSYFDISNTAQTFVFDTELLGSSLKSLLEVVVRSTVIVHDGRMEVVLLKHWYQVNLSRVLDTQIIYESVHKIPFASLTKFLGLSKYSHILKKHVDAKMDQGLVWKKPYSDELLLYAAHDAELLLKAAKDYCKNFKHERLNKWIEQSTNYIQSITFPELAKEMVFDDDYCVTSKFVFEGTDTKIEPISVLFDFTDLEPILPTAVYEALSNLGNKNVRDLILDVNERPRVYFNDGLSVFLFEDTNIVFGPEDIDSLVSHLEIGTDNRAILNGSFHRISVMRNLKGNIYGITIRMGRFVSGLTSILADVVHSDDSVLFLGPPGTGKSSFIRDCIRLIGKKGKLLIVVDTSNELCGNGDFVHPLLYPARRLMVKSLEKQKEVMIEAVQNHTPDVLVIDEIGRSNEVIASKTVKTRGVRVIASAHGSFDELFKNKDLNGLLGGFQQVILSDAMAQNQHDRRKLKLERGDEPVFDTIVELVKGSPGHVRIIRDVKSKVDAKLENQNYTIEERWATGRESMFVRLETCR
jgi:stage III sporulation protein SpoIIIAA